MKNWLLALAVALPLSVSADIAVLDQNGVLFTSAVAEQENVRLQEELGEADAQRRSLQEKLQTLQSQWQNDKDLLSEEELATLQQSLMGTEQQLIQLSNQLNQVQQQRQQAFVQQYRAKLAQAVKSVLDETPYDLVVDANAVVFAKPDMDISAKVLEKFNELTEAE